MFGYVIPVKSELKVREFDQFRAAYCGLCHALRREYGLSARFILNYDFTFLALLLSAGEQELSRCRKRCVASPHRKKCVILGGESFRRAAGYSVILTRWKLRDAVADDGFFRGLAARFGGLFLRRAYKRAVGDFPDFDAHCRDQLDALSALERENSGDLDRTADTFANILAFAAKAADSEEDRRILEQLLYHTGRWIYLIDAFDDLESDRRSGRYNPILARFSMGTEALSGADKAWLNTTLIHSTSLAASAYNLLPEGQWGGVLENIIYLGLPTVTEHVLEEKWRRRDRKRLARKETTTV